MTLPKAIVSGLAHFFKAKISNINKKPADIHMIFSHFQKNYIK